MLPSSLRPSLRAFRARALVSASASALASALPSAFVSALLLTAALPAAAQAGRDPADITQGTRDPAAVGVGGAQPPARSSSAADTARVLRAAGVRPDGPQATPLPADAAQTLQSLLYAARDLGDTRYDVNGRQRAGIDAVRRDMERVATQLWPHLSPQTQERYREALEQIKRLDRLENTDYRDVDAFRARGGAAGMLRETEDAVRDLEAAIAPMLQDVQSKLRQQSGRP